MHSARGGGSCSNQLDIETHDLHANEVAGHLQALSKAAPAKANASSICLPGRLS